MFPKPKGTGEILSKPGLMTNNPCLPYSITSLFASQRVFVGLSPKSSPETESSMSPTSILETKPFSSTDKNPKKPRIGLGLVDDLVNEERSNSNSLTADCRMVLFGSQLKIQIPSMQSNSIESPIEFGVKTRNSQLGFQSPVCFAASPSSFSPRLLTEMELSEDYTCVISHGPNPKTTHIFDNCIVESCGVDGYIASRRDDGLLGEQPVRSSDDFLSFCHGCKKNLSQGQDIFMYRGEKAFCSQECRNQEMLFDEGMENSSQDL